MKIAFVLVSFLVFPLLTFAAPLDPSAYSAPVRVACVGDSITAGMMLKKGESYPDQLQVILGDKWLVKNFGVNSRTLMKKGDHPYWIEQAFTDARKFQPDVVIILLGANDNKPENWVHHDDFEPDYKELVETFKNLPSKPRIFICRPTPVPPPGQFNMTETNVVLEIALIDKVAAEENVDVIDMHAPLLDKPALFVDRVHPTASGARILAQTAATALTGKTP